ncbi:Putative ankyrin repeat-containing domain superfamily [Colletotrichum destructivum]|uniref:Ankyrin repeat-containing domain superfamily n=1 Tax=Colletotrichum destructivum TaxID=34406 RepID=A0AAX4IQV2_9PEZI|nr:Putative ankyrin repeat-containing domain superfamily [Colletotrichum destructivum]
MCQGRVRHRIGTQVRNATITNAAFTASPNTGHRLLWLTAKAGHAPVIEALLDAGAGPFEVNELGNPSSRTLNAASILGDVRIVELLVEAGVDPNMFLVGGKDVQPDWYTYPEPEACQHGYCQPSPSENTYQYER